MTLSIQPILTNLHFQFKKVASLENKSNFERYFKGVVKFYGLKSLQVKQILKIIWPEIKKLTIEQRIELVFDLFQSKYFEDKSCAIQVLNKSLKQLSLSTISDLEKIIDQYVYDWATCDMLSGQVVRYLIESNLEVLKKIIGWKDARCLWRQRAVAVSFVPIARHGRYNQEIITVCQKIIQNPERFVQLGAGWVLRELSLADLDLVINFIKKNYQFFSREGLRYAIEKMEPGVRKKILDSR
jgi:3-methyladenine DNA glycosylase AlkD